MIALRVGLVILIVVILVALLLLFYLWASGRVWYPRQRARVTALADESVAAVDEDRFAAGRLDDGLPLSTLRMIASHNSYHREPDWIRRFLIGLVEPEEAAALRYSHRPLWEQLEQGVRSFELDVRARERRFTVTHVPLVDDTGPHPDLGLALREIRLWSERRPGHVPIIVLLELKSDWMFLDPGLRPWDSRTLSRLDALVRQEIPSERLLAPAVVLRNASSLLDAVSLHGWPSLGQMRNRIMLVVHTDSAIDRLYAADDPTLRDRPMFTSRPGRLEATDTKGLAGPAVTRPDAVVVIHNHPDPVAIAKLTEMGLIVRTRADGDGSAPPEQRAAALASTVQIVSTDLPPGHPNDRHPGAGLGAVEFAVGKTLMQPHTAGHQ